MIRRPSVKVLMVALFAIMLMGLLAGCSSAPAASKQSAPSSPASGPVGAVPAPTIRVLSPLSGAAVSGSEVSVSVEITGLKFAKPSNTLVPGEGHVHFTLDDQPFQMSITPDYVFKDVAPGAHTLRSELVQNDTTPFSPAVFEIVKFTVK